MENLVYSPIDAAVNIVLCGLFYGPAFCITSILALIVPPWTLSDYFRRVTQLALFVALLLLVGALFSSLWGNTIWGWLYRSTDYCGNDFFPFNPIGHAALDAPFGNEPHGLLAGATLTQLHIAWFCFALATWSVTFNLYYLVSGRLDRLIRSSPVKPKRNLLPECKALMAKTPNGDTLDDLDAVRGDR